MGSSTPKVGGETGGSEPTRTPPAMARCHEEPLCGGAPHHHRLYSLRYCWPRPDPWGRGVVRCCRGGSPGSGRGAGALSLHTARNPLPRAVRSGVTWALGPPPGQGAASRTAGGRQAQAADVPEVGAVVLPGHQEGVGVGGDVDEELVTRRRGQGPPTGVGDDAGGRHRRAVDVRAGGSAAALRPGHEEPAAVPVHGRTRLVAGGPD